MFLCDGFPILKGLGECWCSQMRLSIRKVVKYSTFLVIFFVINIWVSYNVNLWSFQNSHTHEKVRKSLLPSLNFVDDNGGVGNDAYFDVKHDLNEKNLFGSVSSHHRQRSAKSLSVNEDSRVNLNQNEFIHRINNGPVQQVVSQPRTRGQEKPTKDGQMTDLEDIFISVKTTLNYHGSRVRLLLKTWYGLASEQTYFFTDGEDSKLSTILGKHLVNTNCTADHSRRALSCKMAVEFDAYMASRKRWFCHIDDDVYVNVPQLMDLLRKYNHKEDWYLGKPSLKHPLEVADRENPGMKLSFWFATGGAGFCISRSLALKMAPHASGGRFMTTAERIRLPDDCTLGYIIEYILRQKLTIIPEFHSHLENLRLIKEKNLKKQVTFSFSDYSGRKNVVNVPGFTSKEDPTRQVQVSTLFPVPKFPNVSDNPKEDPAFPLEQILTSMIYDMDFIVHINSPKSCQLVCGDFDQPLTSGDIWHLSNVIDPLETF